MFELVGAVVRLRAGLVSNDNLIAAGGLYRQLQRVCDITRFHCSADKAHVLVRSKVKLGEDEEDLALSIDPVQENND